MKRYVVFNKQVGETPLEALKAWKKENLAYTEVPASYAGRLDPMAEGKLLVLLGEECKKQKLYTKLDKEYEIEVLLDVGSDTGDALGLVEYSGKETFPTKSDLAVVLRNERGNHIRAYPRFSSKTVNGKPLFLYSLEGTIDDIDIPEHEERVYAVSHLGTAIVGHVELQKHIEDFLQKVPMTDEPSKALGADFRITLVTTSWKKLFEEAGERKCTVLRLRVVCGSGTYMRTLAPRIGEALGTRALALSIKRTKIGKCWRGVWLLQY